MEGFTGIVRKCLSENPLQPWIERRETTYDERTIEALADQRLRYA